MQNTIVVINELIFTQLKNSHKRIITLTHKRKKNRFKKEKKLFVIEYEWLVFLFHSDYFIIGLSNNVFLTNKSFNFYGIILINLHDRVI